jgi:hypothetical protein
MLAQELAEVGVAAQKKDLNEVGRLKISKEKGHKALHTAAMGIGLSDCAAV